MRVIGRWVAVQVDEKKQTASGIQLLEGEKKHSGIVKGVGDKAEGIEVGQEVAFTPFAYFEHELNGEKLYFLDYKDIQAIL